MSKALVPHSDSPYTVEIRKKYPFYKIISLGGCTTYEVARLASNELISHDEHLWRRPTIALMSLQSNSEAIPDIFPSAFSRYWIDDFNKSHINYIEKADSNVLIFDITRDIWSGVMRLNQNSFVIDPFSSMHFVAALPPGALAAEVTEHLQRQRQVYDFKHEAFLEIWKLYIEKFLYFSCKKFEHIIVNKFFFTNALASNRKDSLTGKFATIESSDFSDINNILEEMYDYIKSFDNVKINQLNRSCLLTAKNVPWGGPFPTHYIPETATLFAENVRTILLGKKYYQGTIFIKQAFARAKSHEDLSNSYDENLNKLTAISTENNIINSELNHLKTSVSQISQERDIYQTRKEALDIEFDQLKTTLSQASQELDIVKTERKKLNDEFDRLQTILTQVSQERDIAKAERERLIAERSQLQAVLAQVSQERDTAAIERERLAAERSRLQAVLAQTTAEKTIFDI